MNRPKKNKIKNDTLPEDMQVDERNLIDAEESVELSFEDRINMYWMENKGFVTGCIIVLALIIIGFNGMRIYSASAEAKVQAAYAEAMANESLEVFAKEYSDETLGGLAALDTADFHYVGREFDTAIEYYNIAAGALDNDILSGRARLGIAFATYYKGDTEAAITQLKAIVADASVAGAIRAEAAYHLAVDADVAGDSEAFENYAAQVADTNAEGQWQMRMQMYETQR